MFAGEVVVARRDEDLGAPQLVAAVFLLARGGLGPRRRRCRRAGSVRHIVPPQVPLSIFSTYFFFCASVPHSPISFRRFRTPARGTFERRVAAREHLVDQHVERHRSALPSELDRRAHRLEAALVELVPRVFEAFWA